MLKPLQQLRYKEWAAQVDDWRRSDLTQKEWCARHGMKLSTFKHRIWRLNRVVQACVQNQPKEPAVPVFAELPEPERSGEGSSERSSGSCVMRVRIGNALIEMTDNATESQLRLVMEVIARAQ